MEYRHKEYIKYWHAIQKEIVMFKKNQIVLTINNKGCVHIQQFRRDKCVGEMTFFIDQEDERKNIAWLISHLTPLALDGGDSAPRQAEFTPEVLSSSLAESTPTRRQ